MPSTENPTIQAIDLDDKPTVIPGGRFISTRRDLRAGFKAHNILASFGYAFEGLLYATRTQRNFRIHLCITIVAFTLALLLHITLIEMAVLAIVIGIVLFAELANTTIELFVDMLTEGRYDIRAKAIKDMAAGAVLITAISALTCGVCIFVPYLSALFISTGN